MSSGKGLIEKNEREYRFTVTKKSKKVKVIPLQGRCDPEGE